MNCGFEDCLNFFSKSKWFRKRFKWIFNNPKPRFGSDHWPSYVQLSRDAKTCQFPFIRSTEKIGQSFTQNHANILDSSLHHDNVYVNSLKRSYQAKKKARSYYEMCWFVFRNFFIGCCNLGIICTSWKKKLMKYIFSIFMLLIPKQKTAMQRRWEAVTGRQ